MIVKVRVFAPGGQVHEITAPENRLRIGVLLDVMRGRNPNTDWELIFEGVPNISEIKRWRRVEVIMRAILIMRSGGTVFIGEKVCQDELALADGMKVFRGDDVLILEGTSEGALLKKEA